MYLPIENGTCIEIPDNAFGYIYKCWIPPYGKGYNVATEKVEDADIIKRSEIDSEQYWEREGLPADYKDRRKREKERQLYDKKYVDPFIESFRKKQWKRRLCGIWFWNNGEAVYLTGLNWLYLEHWRFQGKYNDYRKPDRDSFYVINHNIEDPRCLGTNEIMNRKNGKTSRAGIILYDRTSRMAYHHGSLQSKGGKDAKEMFKKAIVQPWRTLVDYFRPIYDLMKGDDPSDELRFFATSRRGQNAELEEAEEALESWIDHASADEAALDGPELHTYVSDETSKTPKDVSIIERQNVTRFCTEIGGVFVGYHHYCTTVEIEEGEEENPEFQQLTAMSNPLIRDDNGRTLTGLYTYFRPAHHSLFFDRYGEPEIERAIKHLMNTRNKLIEEGKLRELSSFKRKQPMTFAEAFSVDGEKTLYNPELLNRQLENIVWRNDLTERGDLEWINGDRFWTTKTKQNGEIETVLSRVEWIPNANGKYEKVKGFVPIEANNVYENYGKFYPNNNSAFRIGADTFKFDKTKDKRRSNGAAFAYQIPDELHPNIYDDYFPVWYVDRPEDTDLQHESILKLCWWLGCQCLFERNVYEWKKYFINNNCHEFLMYLPGEVEPGIYTDGQGTTVQTICTLTNAYINKHNEKIMCKELIQKESGWLGFKVEDTKKFDRPMSAGICLIAVRGVKNQKQSKLVNIEDYFHTYKIG